MRRRLQACPRLSAPAGSDNVAVCLHPILPHPHPCQQGGTWPSQSVSRSHLLAPVETAFATLPANLVGPQWHADRAAMRPKPAKLLTNPALRDYVQNRLAGNIATPGGQSISGPRVEWKGRRHGRRQARRWSRAWSPEQIANRLLMDFPEDTSMRINHEAIYQALYVQGRGALRRELTACVPAARCVCPGNAYAIAGSRS